MHCETDGQNRGALMSEVNESNWPNVMKANTANIRDDKSVELQNNSAFSLIIFSCMISIYLAD